jgi:hypothetical protein
VTDGGGATTTGDGRMAAAASSRGRCPPWTEAGRNGRARRKFEARKKKITRVFWPFRVPIHVGTSRLSAM